MERAIAERAFPGAAWGLLLDGEVVALDAAGRFTYDRDSPEVTPSTIFDLASLTKVMVTTAMAMVLLLPRARAQNPDQIMPDVSAAKAKAILQQAIDGLGGAAYVNVHNSECTGRYGAVRSHRQAQGEAAAAARRRHKRGRALLSRTKQ